MSTEEVLDALDDFWEAFSPEALVDKPVKRVTVERSVSEGIRTDQVMSACPLVPLVRALERITHTRSLYPVP